MQPPWIQQRNPRHDIAQILDPWRAALDDRRNRVLDGLALDWSDAQIAQSIHSPEEYTRAIRWQLEVYAYQVQYGMLMPVASLSQVMQEFSIPARFWQRTVEEAQQHTTPKGGSLHS